MMRHKIKFLILILALTLSTTLVSARAELSEGIGVDIVKPSNQIDSAQTYFDLDITDIIEQQTLTVYVDNHETREMELKIRVTDAYTNMNGEIDYHPNDNKDVSMKYGLTDLIKDYPKKIKVPKQSRVPITFTLQKPIDLERGEILGGIYLENVLEDKPQKDMITNNFAYVKGVRLLNEKVLKKVKLNLTNARVIEFQRKKVVAVNFQNKNAKIIKGMKSDVEITNKKTKENFHSTVDNIDMAPNSNADLVMFKEADELESGEYLVQITNIYKDQTLKFELDLIVNNNKKVIKRDDTLLYVIAGAVLLLLITSGVALYRRNKKNY